MCIHVRLIELMWVPIVAMEHTAMNSISFDADLSHVCLLGAR